MARTKEFLDSKYDYNILVLPTARFKMETYCDLSEGEIGWLGLVSREGNNFLIEDTFLLKQEVHAATTELNPQAILDLWNELSEEDQQKLKIWGHSHVNMEPSPSGQDNSQMDYFKDTNDWFVRLITNKKRKYHIDIYDYKNGVKVHFDESDLKTYSPDNAEIEKAIAEEIKEKVTEKKYTSTNSVTPYKSYSSGYSSYSHYSEPSKKEIEENLGDIKVEYISSFESVINDPNYWQDISLLKEEPKKEN